MKRRILLCAISALLLAALALCGTCMAEARWPQSSSGGQKTNGTLKLDVTATYDGYFMAAVSKKSKHRMKLRVVKDGQTLTYDLNTNGDFEVFPLQLGSGNYEISLWENVSGKKYSNAGKLVVGVKLTNENVCYLFPNQYVNYTKKSAAVKEAEKLCSGKSEKKSYTAIKEYMSTKFVYDFIKAATIKPSVLPDIDGSFKKHSGVCQDLSAIMVCMLRTQGIPAKLVIGYADKTYHAWVVTIIDGKEIFFDPTAVINNSKPKKYTVERYY